MLNIKHANFNGSESKVNVDKEKRLKRGTNKSKKKLFLDLEKCSIWRNTEYYRNLQSVITVSRTTSEAEISKHMLL